MNKRRLGSTGLDVSEIGLGTWGMTGEAYGAVVEERCREVLVRALETGVTLVDVGDQYGRGRVERLVGEAIRRRRDDVVLSLRIGNDFYRSVPRKNFAPAYLSWALEQSLGRLGTDRVDVLLLHNPSIETMRRGDCFAEARRLVQAGKARAWGVSTARAPDARVALENGAEVLQLPYNLLHQRILHAIADGLPEPRPGILAHSPLEYGVLAGKILATTRFGDKDHRRKRYTREELRRRALTVGRLRFLVHDGVATMAEAALRFCLSTALLSAVVVGTADPAHLTENCRASGDGPALPAADLTKLSQVLPTEEEPT